MNYKHRYRISFCLAKHFKSCGTVKVFAGGGRDLSPFASAFSGVILATPRRHGRESHGLWYTAKSSQIAPMPPEKSGILKQEKVAMISIGLRCGAVAATTGRGFKSRRPDSCDCR